MTSVWPILEPLLPKVAKPIQYVGGELNSTVKDWDSASVRWALMYPDAYEVGIPNQGVQISGNNWSIAITSTTQFQQGAVNESEQHVTIEKGNTVTTFGTGFLPFTQVDVYVYSTPQWLGSVITDAQGNYVVTLNMPVPPSKTQLMRLSSLQYEMNESTSLGLMLCEQSN